jgi:hypothetical protein
MFKHTNKKSINQIFIFKTLKLCRVAAKKRIKTLQLIQP